MVCATIGGLLGPADVEWMPLWGALASVYVVLAAALWREHPAARPVGLALALGGLACSIQGWVVAGPMPLMLWGVVGHGVWTASLLFVPRRVSRRNGVAVALAGAAIPCALMYGLAPQQDPWTTVGMLTGAGLVLTSALGVSRGRTWGLLLAPLGAVAVGSTVASSPRCGCLTDGHPLLPEAGLAITALGVAAAVLATLAFLVYVAPMVRFVRRR